MYKLLKKDLWVLRYLTDSISFNSHYFNLFLKGVYNMMLYRQFLPIIKSWRSNAPKVLSGNTHSHGVYTIYTTIYMKKYFMLFSCLSQCFMRVELFPSLRESLVSLVGSRRVVMKLQHQAGQHQDRRQLFSAVFCWELMPIIHPVYKIYPKIFRILMLSF